MRDTKSKNFALSEVSEVSEEFSLDVVSSDFEKDDDKPLSIGSLSMSFLGITIALLTIVLPSISVLLGRPFIEGNEIIFNHSFKKDGS